MITEFKAFENNFEIKEIDLYKDIYKGEPNRRFIHKNHEYVINKLRALIGKFVNFTSRKVGKTPDGRNFVQTTLHNGFVEDVAYDNEGGNKISYIKLEGDNRYHSVDPEDKIFINITISNSKKYNL